jgi:hypothetical protein
MTAAAAWQTIGGIAAALGMIGLLARISYQLGSWSASIRDYMRTNDAAVGELRRQLGQHVAQHRR